MSDRPGAATDLAGARADARFAAALARRVGQLLLDHFRRDDLESQLKADYSLVTEADVAADELIAAELARAYPDDALLTEELSPRYDDAADAVWVVDPLDGTTNFAAGLQHWGVCLARVVGGYPRSAALFFPALDELYVAVEGGGATLNGKALAVRPPSSARPLGLLACCSRTPRLYHLNLPYKVRVFGSSAYGLVTVARGSAAIAFETRPKIWDLAAASLVVREAGGVFESLGESHGAAAPPFPLRTGLAYADLSYPVLAAASSDLAAFALEHIQPR